MKTATHSTSRTRRQALWTALLVLCTLLVPMGAHAQTASNTYEDRVELAWPAGWGSNRTFSVHVFRQVLADGEMPDSTRGDLVMVEAADKGLWADRSGVPMQRYEYCLALKNPAGADQAFACTEGRRVIRPILDLETGFAQPVAAAVQLNWRNTSALPGRTTRIYRSALNGTDLSSAVFSADSILAQNLSASTTLYRDTSATPGLTYAYALATVVQGAESERAIERGQRAVVPSPTKLKASDGTDPAAVRLSWTLGEAFAISRFEVSRDLADGNPGVVLGSVPATDLAAGAAYDFTDATADPALIYNYCVTAIAADGTASAPACDGGSRTGLEPPTAVDATDYVWDDRIEVSWAYDGTTADGFAILRGCLSGPANAPCPPGPPTYAEIGRVAKAQRTYADRTAVQEVIYRYQIVAFSTLGGVSAIGNAQYDDGVRAYVLAPTTVAATDGALEDKVAVTWTNPATTALVFNVTRDGAVIGVVSATQLSLVDTDIASDQTHTYCVASLTIPENLSAAAAATLRADVQAAMGRYGSTEGLLSGTSSQAERERLVSEVERLIASSQRTASASGQETAQAAGPPEVSAPVCDDGFRSLRPPTAVAATDAADGDDERFVRITWQDASQVEQGYRIYRRPFFDTTTPPTLVARTGPNRTQVLDTTAAPGERYLYIVRTYDALGPVQTDALGNWGGQSRIADASGTQLAADEGRRELLAATNVRATDGRFENQVEITWNDNSAVVSRAGYRVYRWPTASGMTQPAGAALVCTTDHRATSCIDTQLGGTDYGLIYAYRVVAFDAYGEASPAAGAADRDEGGTVILPPQDLNASNGYADKVTLAWNDVSNVNTGYAITVDGVGIADVGDVGTFTHQPGDFAQHRYCLRALARSATSKQVCVDGKQMSPDGGGVMSSFGLELTSSSTPGSVGAGDFFGLNVAVNADNLLAGALGRNSGSAVLYTRADGVWQENSVLGGSGTFGRFGEAVALTNTQAIVGAPEGSGLNNQVTVEGAWKSNGASGTDTCPGAPRIFPPPQCSWTGQSQRRYRYVDGGAYVYNLQSGNLEAVLRSGSGGLLATPSDVDGCVVGCPSKPSAIDSRDRRVYSSNPYGPTVTNPTNWAEQATWDDTGARATGKLVATAGRWAFVASGNVTGTYSEELHVFERQGAGWVPRQIIPNVDRNKALAFDGTTMIYSSYGPAFAYYHVFLYDGTNWTQNKLTYFNPRVPGVGAYLAVKDDLIAVATDSGILVYRRANGVWPDAPTAVLTPPTNVTSVALSEADGAYYLVAGDEHAGGRGTDSGAGYAYLFEGDAWTYIGELLPGTSADDLSGLGLGRSVALDGSNPILGGAYQFSGTQAGALYFGALGRPPSGVAASDGTYDNRIQVRWNDRTDIEDGFRVYRSTDTPGVYDLIGSVGADVGVYDDFDAAPGSAYDYCIAAYTLTKSGEEESQRLCDIGWLPADGRIAGRVASRDGAGVANVDVCLDPSPNRGLLFDGTGGDAITTAIDTLPAAFTVEAWIKRDVNGQDQFFFSQGTTSNNNGLHIGFRGHGGFTVAFWYNDYEVPTSAFPAGYDAEAWNHWAVTVDGSTRQVFLNGVELAGTPSPAPAPYGGRGPLYIGSSFSGSRLVGLMDEMRLWKGVRAAAEIRDHMNGALGGGENNLIAYWPLEQIGGTVAPDVTDGRAHLTLNNGTFWGGGSDGLEACATTDDDGTYTHAGLRYGDGAKFEVRPRAANRTFLPATQTVNLTPESQVENQLNFTDTSVFTFEGQVTLGSGTGSCPADSVDILVDGQYKATTKADGTYALSVNPTSDDDPDNRSRTLTAQRKGRDGNTLIFAFAPGLIDTTATKNLDGLDFAVTTERTLSGFVGGSCNTVLGTVTLRVYTEDGCFDRQVVANPNFTLQLPPQKYFVDVVDVQIAQNSPLSRASVLAFYDALGTQVADLTEADATLDLLYRAPVEVVIAGLPAPVQQCDASGIAADGRTLDNVPVLAEYDRPLLTITVQENYGGGNVCFVPDAEVKIFDGIADQADKATVDTTDATGKVRYRTFARSPEITSGAVVEGVDRSYQKSLTASVAVPGRGTTTETVWAIVEGYRERASEFVSATTAEMPLMVLHDPPGSGSYAYIEEGTTSCSRLGKFQLTGGGAGVLVDAALGFKSAAGIFITIENGAALLLQTKTIFGRNNQRLDGGPDSNIEICATTTKRISTSADDGWVGEDLMVGTALNLKFALADDLKVNQCRIDFSEKLATDLDEVQPFATTYVYGTTHIKQSLIPSLENLVGLNDATLTGDEDGNKTLETIKLSDALAGWKRYLALNDSTVEAAFKGRAKYENRSFSGASEFEWSHTADTTRTLRQDVTQIYIDSENAIGAVATLVGYDSKFAAAFEVRQEWTTERDSTQQNTKTVGYVMADGDAGDFMSVDVGTDPTYGTPAFRTVSGRTSNPWESGTQRRDWPEVSISSPVQRGVAANGAASFDVTLRNRSESKERRQYVLALVGEDNPGGLGVMVNGGRLGSTGVQRYTLDPDESVTIKMEALRAPGNVYDYDDVALIFYPQWEYNYWLGDTRFPATMIDTARFSVSFTPPCSPITLLRPQTGWSLNADSPSGTLELFAHQFSIPQTSDTRVGFEYRRNGGPWQTAAFQTGTQLAGATEWAYTWTPPGEGTYQTRAYAQCKLANGEVARTETVPVEGSVSQTMPQVVSTPQPADGALNLGDDVAIRFTRSVDCSTAKTDDVGGYRALGLRTADSTFVPVQAICDGSGIVLAPRSETFWSEHEGEVFTAFVSPPRRSTVPSEKGRVLAGLTDAASNPVAAADGSEITTEIAWTFVVQRSAVAWTPSNVGINVPPAQPATFTATLANGRAQPIDFALGGPFKLARLDANGVSTGDSVAVTPSVTAGHIVSGGAQVVRFDWPGALDLGQYRAALMATARAGAQALGAVPLDLTVNVTCAPPLWTLAPQGFEFSMTAMTRLVVDGVPSQDENDRIAAFVGGELRGTGTLARFDNGAGGTEYLTPLSIHSNQEAGEAVEIQVWDDSACRLYTETSAAFVFVADAERGTPARPYTIHAPVGPNGPATVNLLAGWTWLSTNRTPTDPAVAEVLGNLFVANGDLVKSQTQFALYDDAAGWAGSLQEITPGPAYLARLTASNTLVLDGTPVDVGALPLVLKAGWTWVGYLPQAAYPLGYALQNVTAQTDDLIKGQFGFAQYLSGYGWIGSLAQMRPGEGYMMKMQQPATLAYPTTPPLPDAAASAVPASVQADAARGEATDAGTADAPTWTVDAAQYEHSMSITATLEIDGVPVVAPGSMAAAFAPGEGGAAEVRGVGSVQYVAALQRHLVFLTAYSNAAQGETLSFEFYDASADATAQAGATLAFEANGVAGTLQQPVTLDPSRATAVESEVGIPDDYVLLPNQPNPVFDKTVLRYGVPQAGHVRLVIYDLLGREVYRVVDREQAPGYYRVGFEGSDLASGVYVLRLEAGGRTETQRMVVLK